MLFILVLLFLAPALGQNKTTHIGEIEFFGSSGQDLAQIRSALPVKEGDAFSLDNGEETIQRITLAVKQFAGKEPTDVNLVCCDHDGNWMIYIGLPGNKANGFRYHPQPQNSIRLPQTIVNLYQQAMDGNMEAVMKQAPEDSSQGYALSSYPPLRATQLAIRKFAIRNELQTRRVLQTSRDPKQRAIAAQVLGYARESQNQIAALVRASHDIDDSVRNNAVRALGVLAESGPTVAARIPAAPFVAMLNSGVWKDRNKAAMLLGVLSKRRPPRLLQQLRAQAWHSLIEMARWRSFGHAYDARMILGRMAGIEEDRLRKLVDEGRLEEIIRG